MTSSSSDPQAEEASARLEAFYAKVAETAMLGLPMVNPALGVRSVGMAPFGGELLCVLITPWFMNLVLIPLEGQGAAAMIGTKSRVMIGGSAVEFIQSDGEGIGPHRMCSLFSPVFEFEDMESAVLTAAEVLRQLLEGAEIEADDDGMQAIWEGRIGDAEARAVEERQAAARVAMLAEAERSREPELTRRALFGLGNETPAREAVP